MSNIRQRVLEDEDGGAETARHDTIETDLLS